MLHKARQTKSKTAQVYAERLYALANDAFANVDKDVVESQLLYALGNDAFANVDKDAESQIGGFFMDSLFHHYLRMKVMRENHKTFQAAAQSALAEQNLRKRFQIRTVDSQSSKS